MRNIIICSGLILALLMTDRFGSEIRKSRDRGLTVQLIHTRDGSPGRSEIIYPPCCEGGVCRSKH